MCSFVFHLLIAHFLMHKSTQSRRPSLLAAIVSLRCPRCRKGPLFLNRHPYVLKGLGEMHDECPNCGQDYVIEPGFYFGAAMISYIIQIGLIGSIAIGMYLFGVRNKWAYMIAMSTVILLSVPYMLTISRAIWLSFFVRKQEKEI